MKIHYYLLLTLTISACTKNMERKEIVTGEYPNTKRDTTANTYFGTTIPDPYQWLENDTAQDVVDWVVQQNKFTQNYFLFYV